MAKVIACDGDQTDPLYGPPGAVHSITPSVVIGGRAACTIGSPVDPHGNYNNPRKPGFNPTCAAAQVQTGSTTVFIEGRAAAEIDTSLCTCGLHHIKILNGTNSVTSGS